MDSTGPACPEEFFKIMQFSGNFKGKTLILSKFWAQGPHPWGQNSAIPPDQNPVIHQCYCSIPTNLTQVLALTKKIQIPQCPNR